MVPVPESSADLASAESVEITLTGISLLESGAESV